MRKQTQTVIPITFEAPYRRLTSRKKAKGQLVSFVCPLAQLRAARTFALKSRWSLSEVFRVATVEFLARQKQGGK